MSIPDGLQRLKSLGFNPRGILDVGAYEGWFAREVRKIWPEAYVLMIDAISEKRSALENTARQIGNSEVKICLLGQTEEADVPFYFVKAGNSQKQINTGSSKYRENTEWPIETRLVRQHTLKSITTDTPRQFDLIKLDVQGAELDVLTGAGDVLDGIELILMEMSLLEYNKGAPLIADVIARLQQLGFVLFDIFELSRFAGHLNQVDGVFVRATSNLRFRFQGS